MKILLPVLSIVLLSIGVVLTQASSPNYRWVMFISMLCAVAATGGFLVSARASASGIGMAFKVLAAVGILLSIFGVVALASMVANR